MYTNKSEFMNLYWKSINQKLKIYFTKTQNNNNKQSAAHNHQVSESRAPLGLPGQKGFIHGGASIHNIAYH